VGALGFVLRLLLVLFLLRLFLRFVGGVMRGLKGRQPVRPSSAVLVRDPMCQTFVAPQRAVRGRFLGHEALFCSAACRDQAAALPGTR
jgi:hypothetical protein